ncbi:neuronal acetylcholine receptor subunit alpha-10-like [Rissa tridactyla]|uniref:neuronal acetylcholine receptor subunit alpha-10-like n=1 Tax=Rissa tridactyla TaxID=75485 RepID=UPI0023BB0087|nr:neuronal acetylcholine receptor subunit alpha-10-like [Rissa tridactyla]
MAGLCSVYEVDESCKSPRRVPGRQAGREDTGGPGESRTEGEVGAKAGGCPRHCCLCHHNDLLRNVGYVAGCFWHHRASQCWTGERKKVSKVMDCFFMCVFFLMVNQVLTSYLWVRQAWLDAHLAWDKDAYGGIDSIRIPSSYVWRPHIIILYNDTDDGFGGSVETNVVLRSDGHIMWDSPAITKSSCKVDVSYLPFDGQRCRLTFGSWTYNGNQIDLHNRLGTGDLTDFVENVEWEALGMPATRNVITYGCCSEPYPDVTYTLLLCRRASFYIFSLLLPCIMVSFLAPLGFYLPADSGEKVSLGVTVLLALTVFQLLVAESMQPSESVPLIGKYYIATMTMITASTALTIFIMNVHHCGPGPRPVPPWARWLILHHMAWLCCVYEVGECCKSPQRVPGRRAGREDTGGPGESPMEGEVGAEAGGCPRDCCLCHHDGLLRNVGYVTGCCRHHQASQYRTGEWKKVAKVMDRFFMWVFFLMVFLMSVLVLGNAA